MTLTLYIAHILVFNLFVDWLGWVRPTGLDTAASLAARFNIDVTDTAFWRSSLAVIEARIDSFIG